MFRIVISTIAVMCCWAGTTRANEASYSIVVSKSTHSDAGWNRVVGALASKYPGAQIIVWDRDVIESLEALSEEHPRYTCFVATPSEATREFVSQVHRLTRQFDSDPYTDTLWGILTGFDSENALSIAGHNEPLTVRKVASGTEVAFEMCSQGVWYDELVPQKRVRKTTEGEVVQGKGPVDTTRALAETLSEYRADLFVTSGHATERDWQIGYTYRNGSFRSKAGQMFGVTTRGERFQIQSEIPKVYLPIGNCLMGHIDGPDAMALAWMNSVGVKQMIGYTVVTWYGYGGWGVLDYFVEQPGRYTLAEAFHANHHALINRMQSNFDGLATVDFTVGSRRVPAAEPNTRGKAAGLQANDARGLLWDRDTVAFYGDPGWSARMESQPKAYDQRLIQQGSEFRLTILPRRGEKSFAPVNTNGAQRGWRPIVQLLPTRIANPEIIAGAEWNPVIADDFVLIPNPKSCDPSRKYEVVFKAELLEGRLLPSQEVSDKNTAGP